jgi:hypothetical protein
MQKIKLESLEKEITIKKFPIKKYVDVIKKIKNLPKLLNIFDGASQEELFIKLPEIIEQCYEDVIVILSIAVELPTDEIEKLPLDEIVDLTFSFIEVNKYFNMIDKVKKNLEKMKSKKKQA